MKGSTFRQDDDWKPLIPAARSAETGRLQSGEHIVTRLFRAELRGETLGIEKRRQTRDDGTLAFDILLLSKASIGRGKHRIHHQLVHSAGITHEGAVEGAN